MISLHISYKSAIDNKQGKKVCIKLNMLNESRVGIDVKIFF